MIFTKEEVMSILDKAISDKLSMDDLMSIYNFKSSDLFKALYLNKTLGFTKEESKKYRKIYKGLLAPKSLNVTADLTTEDSYENRMKAEEYRDANGTILNYKFRISVHNQPDFTGIITREELEKIYVLYTTAGKNMTAQAVCNALFPNYTIKEFRKILKAFNIYKASDPIALHQKEEMTSEELKGYISNLMIKRLTKESELELEKEKSKLIKEQAHKIQELENIENNLKPILENACSNNSHIEVYNPSNEPSDGKDLIIYLSDAHIGAMSYTCSPRDNDYNATIYYKRLQKALDVLKSLGDNNVFDTIYINIMGDMMDGAFNSTTRGGHLLPQNLDYQEQARIYKESVIFFVKSLLSYKICKHITVNMVSCGNHAGPFEYGVNMAINANLNSNFGKMVNSNLFNRPYEVVKIRDRAYVLFHGKMEFFQKSPFPLHLNPNTKSLILEWLLDNNIIEKEVNFIKGDLHQYTIEISNRLKYKNVPSIYGSSPHSQANYSYSRPGMCYEIVTSNSQLDGIIYFD